jgi:hypothetical protein
VTPYQSEELENIRRAAERGKALAEYRKHPGMYPTRPPAPSHFIDCFVHILDTVERIKKNNET